MPSSKSRRAAPVRTLAVAALFAASAFPGSAIENARLLPMALIDPNPYQARQVFDARKFDELTNSVAQHGVLEPILLRPVGDRFQIVAGERRFRASLVNGLDTIPALIQDLDDIQAAYVTALENLQREDLDLEDEARQFRYLLDLTGLSQRALAEHLGIGFNYLSRRVRLLERPDLLAAYRLGQLTLHAALDQLAEDRTLTGEQTQAIDSTDLDHDNLYPADTLDAAVSAGYSDSARPSRFRWRPAHQFQRWLEQTGPATVPEGERATLLAYLEDLRQKIEEKEAALRSGTAP